MSEVIPRNSPYAPVRVQPLHESKDKERSTMQTVLTLRHITYEDRVYRFDGNLAESTALELAKSGEHDYTGTIFREEDEIMAIEVES